MNKYQEALDVMKKQSFESYEQYCDKYGVKPISVLKELVDKETPKKPIFEELTKSDGKGGKEFWKYLYKCPTCEENYKKNRFINHFNSLDKGIPYCAYCGQKLDWSDDYVFSVIGGS